MTGSTRAIAVVSLLILLLGGCTTHNTYVRGVRDTEIDPEIPPDASVCVAVNPEAKEWEFNDALADKLEKLVVSEGFKVTGSSEADYFLFFEFNRKPLMNRARLEPFSGVQIGFKTTDKEGPFDLTLGLRLVRSELYHESGLAQPSWVGGAVLNEAPTESPKIVDTLLIAAMKAFPEDTGETQKHRMGMYHPDAKDLREE